MDPDLCLAAVAMRQHSTFTRAQARAAGFTDTMMRTRVRQGRWGRMHAGVFRLAGSAATWDQAVFAAWLGGGEGAAISHLTAASLWGVPDVPGSLELSVALPRSPRLTGVRVHRVTRLDTVDRMPRGGVLLTTPTRTILDLCGRLPRHHVNDLLDFFLTRRMTTPDYVRRRATALGTRGRDGLGQLLQMLAARPTQRRAPESRFERRLLSLLETLGPPFPVPQYEVRLPSGRIVRLDAAYPDCRIGIEADSYTFHSGLADWTADHVRRNPLTAMGWRMFAATWLTLTDGAEEFLSLVAHARSDVCAENAL